MAAAKLNAAKKAAAHARAEADEASFQEREKVAAAKRRQEFLNRKAMDGERERNRLRKLGAQTGREWDAEKKEEDYNGQRGGGSQFRRGMHGGVAGFPRRDHNDESEPAEGELASRGRGRGGGRGGRGRGRGGRGGRDDPSSREGGRETSETPSAPIVNNESDFPALPGSSTKDSGNLGDAFTAEKLTARTMERIASPKSPSSPAEGTWADQMESSAK